MNTKKNLKGRKSLPPLPILDPELVPHQQGSGVISDEGVQSMGPGCEVCGELYNWEGTGMCGPCATGDADTYGEGEYVGD